MWLNAFVNQGRSYSQVEKSIIKNLPEYLLYVNKKTTKNIAGFQENGNPAFLELRKERTAPINRLKERIKASKYS